MRPCQNGSVGHVVKRKGRTLNTEIAQTPETDVAEAERRRKLGNLRKELIRFAGSLPPLPDSVAPIRNDRDR